MARRIEMVRMLANGVCLAALMLGAHAAQAAESEQCRAVRMAEPGWNDLAFTTGVANVLLGALGYQPQSRVLGLNVVYEGTKNNDLDQFLGYCDQAMVTDYEPCQKDFSVEKVL